MISNVKLFGITIKYCLLSYIVMNFKQNLLFYFSLIYVYIFLQNELAYFKDDSTYIVPMSVCVREIPGHCYLAELSVVLWLCISPHKTSPEIEAKKDFQLNLSSPASNQKHVQQTGGIFC